MLGLLSQLLARWKLPVSTRTCAALRVSLALGAMNELLVVGPAWDWLGSEGPARTPTLASIFSSEMGRVCLFHVLPAEPVWWLGWLAALCLAVGLFTPLSGWLLWLVLVSVRNRVAWAYMDGGLQVIPAALFWANFLPLGDLWSLDQRIRKRPPREWTDSWPVRLVQFQICLIYVQSGYYKLLGEQWVSGRVMEIILSNPHSARIDTLGLENIAIFSLLCHLAAWVTIFWELTFPLGLLHRQVRRVYLLIGISLHLVLEVAFNIGAFPISMIALYPAFYEPSSPPPGRPRGRGRALIAGGLFLLFCALPDRQLLTAGSKGASNVPGLFALDGLAVKVSQSVTRSLPGIWLWKVATLIGMDHKFTTFAPVVATFTTAYQLVECSPIDPARLIWSSVPSDSRGFVTDPIFPIRMVEIMAAGANSHARIYLFLESYQHQLQLRPDQWLELREFWINLPPPRPYREHLLPGRVWVLNQGRLEPIGQGSQMPLP